MTRLIQLVRESLSGDEQDHTSIGVRRAIVLLSIPMVLEMAMESLFALVDVFFVSRLGMNAVATVGLTEGMLVLVYALALGLGMGVTAVVARRTGEGDPDGAARAALQGIVLATLVGILLSLPGLLAPAWILEVMGASPEVVAEGTGYTRLMVGGNVVIMLLFCINAAFRGAGDATMALRSLWVANGVNIVLCPVLVMGVGPVDGMGVTGAALATLIARGCGVVYQLAHLFRPGGRVELAGMALAVDRQVMATIIRVSGGGMAQFIISSASWVLLVRIVSSFGSAAVAGYTIAVRLILFSLLPGWGLANATSTLVGQNLGAGRPDRAERSAWLCGSYNMVFMVFMAAVFWVLAPSLMGLFTYDAQVAAHGASALRIISLGYCLYSYGMVLCQAFNGAGDTITPLWMNAVCFWIIEIPLAWMLASWSGWGPAGVYASIAISESLLALLSAWVFMRGGWKRARV